MSSLPSPVWWCSANGYVRSGLRLLLAVRALFCRAFSIHGDPACLTWNRLLHCAMTWMYSVLYCAKCYHALREQCHALWALYVTMHYDGYMLPCTMIDICYHALWALYVAMHYDRYMLPCTQDTLCCHALVTLCVTMHFGHSILLFILTAVLRL